MVATKKQILQRNPWNGNQNPTNMNTNELGQKFLEKTAKNTH